MDTWGEMGMESLTREVLSLLSNQVLFHLKSSYYLKSLENHFAIHLVCGGMWFEKGIEKGSISNTNMLNMENKKQFQVLF
jgi:hypothetical protein